MERRLQTLKTRLMEIEDLHLASSLLSWDQSTYMPPGGAIARGRQMSMLARIAQEKSIEPELGTLLDELQPYAESLPIESNDAALIKIARKQYEKNLKIPPQFVKDFSNHLAISYQVWADARPENNFKVLIPYLEKTLEFSIQYADFFPGYDHIADPLIDIFDEDMKAAVISRIFNDLREQLVPMVNMIGDLPLTDDSCLKAWFPEDQQLDFGLKLIKQLGFDFARGRQDKTLHPFMSKFSLGDVRITTRVKENNLGEALFSTIHESGHAMYEQGINLDFEGSPLATGTSASVHESQSRLWENIVGRSRRFWKHFFPQIQCTFPGQLGDYSLDSFYRAINKVERSLIRTDADEVTYNLHVMIRFDLEMRLLEGKLKIHHLPDAWQASYQSNLGIHSLDDRDGVLQNVHWFSGPIGGAFQGYTLGNIMSAIFYNAAMEEHPDIPDQIEGGQFENLLGWLRENIYQYGKKYTANELVERVTGDSLSITPYINYLKGKYKDLYNLDFPES
jgi:carboxypeptidase Taq